MITEIRRKATTPPKTLIIKGSIAVVKFLTQYQYRLANQILPLEQKIALIKKAIAQKKNLNIIYLKGKDEKSRRKIKPLRLAEMEYEDYKFLGLEAFCFSRDDKRTFNVERILEIKEV